METMWLCEGDIVALWQNAQAAQAAQDSPGSPDSPNRFFQVVGGIGFDYENSGLHSEGPDSPGSPGSPQCEVNG